MFYRVLENSRMFRWSKMFFLGKNDYFILEIEQKIDLLFTEFISIPKINICNCFCHFASLWVNGSDDSMMVLVLECSPPPWFQQSQLFWNADSAKRTTWYAESDWPIFMTIPPDILSPCIKTGPVILKKYIESHDVSYFSQRPKWIYDGCGK